MSNPISFKARQRLRQRLQNIEDADEILNAIESEEDYHSGYSLIEQGKNIIIRQNKQMINFTSLTIEGIITIEGDLWLA